MQTRLRAFQSVNDLVVGLKPELQNLGCHQKGTPNLIQLRCKLNLIVRKI